MSMFSDRRAIRRRNHGLTIVEMLVAMTVSLIMIYGMVEFFATISARVTDGRAVIEMAGQQRSAALRLQSDLEGATAPATPWLDPASGLGYLSIREGWGYDLQPIPGAVINGPSTTVQDTSFGDIDDVICLTTRSPQQPHVGTWRQRVPDGDTNPDNDTFVFTTLEGPDAEVIWFTLWQDPDGDGMPQPLDTKLYRRALLIMPSLSGPFGDGIVDQWTRSSRQELLQDFIDFYNYNDISVRPEIRSSGGQFTVTMWANSLSDLTKRENRFCHRPLLALDDPLATNPQVTGVVTDDVLPSFYPFELYRNRPSEAGIGVNRGAGAYDPVVLFPDLTWLAQRLDRTGNDVVASHMVGFDVKVFDPTAWVIADVYGPDLPKWDGNGAWAATDTLVPSDPGYPTKPLGSSGPKSLSLGNRTDAQAIADPDSPHVARGAYVDLNYWRYLFNAPSVNAMFVATNGSQNDLAFNSTGNHRDLAGQSSVFSGPPAYFRDMTRLSGSNLSLNRRGSNSTLPGMRVGWRGLVIPTWDTWPTHYEQNGISEDQLVREPQAADTDYRDKIDQGKNGFDDDNSNGVDDVGEYETSPPYVTPLSSIQIQLRMVESDTRQVRQISVVHDFSH